MTTATAARNVTALNDLDNAGPVLNTIRSLPLDKIQPREDQPRQHYGEEELQALADSIAADGVRTPLRVREAPGGYDLLAGHRRRLAAIRAGLTHVPCIVEDLNDLKALEAVVSDNLNRVDLLPYEEGAGLRALLHRFRSALDMRETRCYTAGVTVG